MREDDLWDATRDFGHHEWVCPQPHFEWAGDLFFDSNLERDWRERRAGNEHVIKPRWQAYLKPSILIGVYGNVGFHTDVA